LNSGNLDSYLFWFCDNHRDLKLSGELPITPTLIKNISIKVLGLTPEVTS